MAISIPFNWSFRIHFLILIVLTEGCVGCIFRSPSWSTIPPTPIIQPTDHDETANGKQPLVLDKDTVSVVEQTLVKTLIAMGKLKFHCPRDDGLYSDMLDCRKYYKCIAGNFTTHECQTGTGFEPSIKSCVANESVPLCQRVQRLNGFECKSTGLKTLTGHCDKFVLCTGEDVFISSCNRGDLFDQRLKLCLPEREVNCNAENVSGDEKSVKLASEI